MVSTLPHAERDIVVSPGSPVVEWKPTLTLAPVKATVLVDAPGYAVINTTTGSKMDASLLDVPQSITVVDHKLLSDQGVYKLDDALKNVAGVMKTCVIVNNLVLPFCSRASLFLPLFRF